MSRANILGSRGEPSEDTLATLGRTPTGPRTTTSISNPQSLCFPTNTTTKAGLPRSFVPQSPHSVPAPHPTHQAQVPKQAAGLKTLLFRMRYPPYPIPELLCSNVAFLGESASPDASSQLPLTLPFQPTRRCHSSHLHRTLPKLNLVATLSLQDGYVGQASCECITLFHALSGVRLAASPPPHPLGTQF